MAASQNQVITVGRVVHFVQPQSPEHCAALVCHVWPDGSKINACVFTPRGQPQPIDGITEDQSAESVNTWHWPERA